MPSSRQRRHLRKALRVLVASLIEFMLYLFVGQWWVRHQADAELLNDPAQLIINDGTLLNRISVAEIYRPQNIADLAKKLADTQGPVSIGGARKSMGGHIASPGSLHIDMRSMNHVLNFDADNQRVTAEAGITWRDLQDLIDEKSLSTQIMQREPRSRCHKASTYLSILEGARAFQARDYTDYLKRGGSASEHSWLNALRQYYTHEKHAFNLAGRYPHDAQDEARLSSLSRRTAIEYLSKALYEATVGALFRLTGEAKGSDEAKLIAEAHDAYGAYITQRPWYEFSFYPWVEKMRQVQSKTQGNSLRRWERKIAFEAEFTIKAASACISEKLFGSLATVEEVVEVEAQLPSKRVTQAFADVKLINKTDAQLKTATISVPRGQKFTERMAQLADAGANFKTISGGGVQAPRLILLNDFLGFLLGYQLSLYCYPRSYWVTQGREGTKIFSPLTLSLKPST